MTTVSQWTSNWWQRGNNGIATTNGNQQSNNAQRRMSDDGTVNKDNKKTINKCLAAEVEDDYGWQEAGHCGGGGGGMCHVHFLTW